MNFRNNNCIYRPFRYDFFTIWGNGLSYQGEILDIIGNEEYLEVIRIVSRRVENMKKFVFDLYACDTVPIEHLRAKLKYLFQVEPEVMIVFVKNYKRQEMPAGQGAFRKVQCQYINQIKIEIRNKFNPQHPDKNFQIKPLNKGVSHEHIIHASDYEEQVYYLLKMLGHKNGIRFLHGDSERLPFSQPYYLGTPKTYIYKTIAIEELRASILDDGNTSKIKKVSETPHYHSLSKETDEYNEYLGKFRYTRLTPAYSWKRFKKLNEMKSDQIKNFDRIIVKRNAGNYRILDGVHRAAIFLNHNLKYIKCVEICE